MPAMDGWWARRPTPPPPGRRPARQAADQRRPLDPTALEDPVGPLRGVITCFHAAPVARLPRLQDRQRVAVGVDDPRDQRGAEVGDPVHGQVSDPGQLIGSEARRALPPGRVLSERDLQAPRLVARGRTVQLVYRRPGLELQALGIAQADGALGELVRVVNLDSRQQLDGVVVGPDRVALGGLPVSR